MGFERGKIEICNSLCSLAQKTELSFSESHNEISKIISYMYRVRCRWFANGLFAHFSKVRRLAQ